MISGTRIPSILWIPVSTRVPCNRREVLIWGIKSNLNGRSDPPQFLGVSRFNSTIDGGRFDVEPGKWRRWVKVTAWAEITGPASPLAARGSRVQDPPQVQTQTQMPAAQPNGEHTTAEYYSWVWDRPGSEHKFHAFEDAVRAAQLEVSQMASRSAKLRRAVIVRAVAQVDGTNDVRAMEDCE